LNPRFDVLGIGLNATDTLILLEHFPPYAGKVPFGRELLSPGGQVATAVIACARLGLSTKYVGTIGDDYKGSLQRQSLEGTGVDISGLIVRECCPNQTAYILIDQQTGERTVLWHRAEPLRLRPDEIHEEDIAASRLLHIDGYDLEAAAYAASVARQNGVSVSVDVDTVYPGFESVLKSVDYLVAGSGWPEKWTGKKDPFQALTQLQQQYGMRVAATTLGHSGALALKDGQWFYSPGIQVNCVDTTGAGDVFHGAFCYGVICGMFIDEALAFSNAAAALNCTAIGARGHLPSVPEIRSLLAEAETGRVRRLINPEIEEAVARRTARASAIDT